MLQVKVIGIGKVIYEDVEYPKAKEGEAVVDVKSVGICGSDIHVFKGVNPVLKPPVVQGHEFGGIVKDINGDASKYRLKIGDKVAVFPIINCMTCYYCKNGLRNMCENQRIFDGMLMDGAMKEQIAVPLHNLIKLPDSFDIIYSAMVEPISVALHAVGKIKNSNVLVIGVGTIGLFVQQICMLNNNTVITIDVDEYSLKKSRKLGADLVLVSSDESMKKKISKFLGDSKLDYIVDCVGNRETLDFAVNAIKKKGKIVLVGVPKGFVEVNMINMLIYEIQIEGSYLYTREDFIKARNYIVRENINVKDVLSRTFPLDRAKEAYDYKISHKPEKVVLVN